MTNSTSPVIDLIPPSTLTVDATPLSPPLIFPTSANLSRTNTTLINQPIRCATPVSTSVIETASTKTSRVVTTPFSLSTVNASTPFSLSVTTGTPLSSTMVNTIDDTNEIIESFRHRDDLELERLMKPKTLENISKPKSFVTPPPLTNRSNLKITKLSVKRTLSNANSINTQRKKRIDITPLIINSRHYTHRHSIVPACTETTKRKDKLPNNKINPQNEKQTDPTISSTTNSPELLFL